MNAYYAKNRKQILNRQVFSYALNREKKLEAATNNSLRRYWPGATAKEARSLYDALSEKQSHLCAICGKPETKKDGQNGKICKLAVDHCPDTGFVRGLLCFVCNTNLGRYERNFSSIVSYLRNAKIGYVRSCLPSRKLA